MEKYRLTVEECFVLGLLFQAGDERHPEYLVKYYQIPITRGDLRETLLSLQNKGVLTKEYKIPQKGQKFDPEAVIFNKNFSNNYLKYSGDLGHEFTMVYPSIAMIQGSEVDLKNWAKKFKTEEDFYYAYGKAIGWSQAKHDEVLELVRWGVLNQCNLLNRNMAEFAMTKGWERIKELKEGGTPMYFDTIKSV